MSTKEYKEFIYLEPNVVADGYYEKKIVKVESHYHRGAKRYMLFFHFDEELANLVKQINGISYSSTFKAWYIDNNPENMSLIFKTFRRLAWVDVSAIFGYNDLLIADTLVNVESDLTVLNDKTISVNAFLSNQLNEDIKSELESYKAWMKQLRYSDTTISTYYDCLTVFFRFFHDKKLNEITNDDLINFNSNYIIASKLSASYQNQIISAIRLFFENKQDNLFDVSLLERPRRYRKLPKVIAKQDVEKMLKSIKNQKHKIAMTIVYACGLRRSELINLKKEDICFKRKTMNIINAKGQKDRILPLSDKLLDMIRSYYELYKPDGYFIEGQTPKSKYAPTSLIAIFHKYMDEILPGNRYTLHCLRHSFATHLLESGTDLRFIQTLLGHKSSKTTEIYTWVSMKSLHNIKNPTDDFDL